MTGGQVQPGSPEERPEPEKPPVLVAFYALSPAERVAAQGLGPVSLRPVSNKSLYVNKSDGRPMVEKVRAYVRSEFGLDWSD